MFTVHGSMAGVLSSGRVPGRRLDGLHHGQVGGAQRELAWPCYSSKIFSPKKIITASLIGSLFIFQGPYFHYFGFIHVNCLIFAGIGSGLHCWQILIFTYAYALIFIHRRFGSLFWLLGVLIGSLFHKKMGPYWVLISKLGGPY